MSQPAPVNTSRTASDMNDLGVGAKPEKFVQAMSKLIMQHPFYAVILMDAMKVVFTEDVEIMATDGVGIYVNPTYIESLTVDEIMFILCHEVLHYILQHMGRGKIYKDRGFGPDLKPYNHGRMNKAADYIINDMLVRGKVGTLPKDKKTGKQIGLHDVKIANFDDIADEVYTKLPDDPDGDDGDGGGSGGDGDGNGDGHGNFDEHLDPSANQPAPSEADVKRTVAQARNAAKAQGKMPAELERLVDDIIEPQKDWKEQLRDEMTSAIGNDESTWARPNRRRLCMNPSIYMPGTTGHAAGTVVVQVDTSGSISQAELTAFLSEVSGIVSDARPERCLVLWVDAAVAGVEDIDYPEQLLELTPKGGGGSDMRVAFDWVKEQGFAPSCLVTLTDGWVEFPDEEPGFKNVWCITDEDKTSPVGTSLHLKV